MNFETELLDKVERTVRVSAACEEAADSYKRLSVRAPPRACAQSMRCKCYYLGFFLYATYSID